MWHFITLKKSSQKPRERGDSRSEMTDPFVLHGTYLRTTVDQIDGKTEVRQTCLDEHGRERTVIWTLTEAEFLDFVYPLYQYRPLWTIYEPKRRIDRGKS